MVASRIGKAFAWSFLEQGGAKAIQLVVQIVLARLLAPEAFGVLAIMLVFVEAANAVAQSGLGMALIQRNGVDDVSYTTALWLSLGLAALMYLALFAGAPAVSGFYSMPELEAYLRVMSLSVLFNSANSIQRARLQREMNFKALFRVNTASFAMSGAVGVGMALAGMGAWALVGQALAQAACACALMAFLAPWRLTLDFRGDEARELFSYGWKVMATGILNVVYTGVSELIIGRACSAGDLGFYSQGRKWPNAAISVVSNAMQNVMFPAFSEMKGDADALRLAIRRMLVMGTFVMAPVSAALAACAPPLVTLLIGEPWLPCVPVFQLACVGNVLLMPQLVNLRAYMALGDSGLYLRLQAVKVGVGTLAIGATALLTRDIYLVALSACLVGAFNTVAVDMAPAARMHGVGRAEQLRAIMPPIALSAVSGTAVWGLAMLPVAAALHPLPMLLAQASAFAAAYLGMAAVFRVEGFLEWRRAMPSAFGKVHR